MTSSWMLVAGFFFAAAGVFVKIGSSDFGAAELGWVSASRRGSSSRFRSASAASPCCFNPNFEEGRAGAAMIGLFSGVIASWAYLSVRTLGRLGEPDWRVVFWLAREMLVRRRLNATNPVHHVASSGAAPQPLTDFADAVSNASYQPTIPSLLPGGDRFEEGQARAVLREAERAPGGALGALEHARRLRLRGIHDVDRRAGDAVRVVAVDLQAIDLVAVRAAREHEVAPVSAPGAELRPFARGRHNVFIERFWRTIKYEKVYLRAYETGAPCARGARALHHLLQWPSGDTLASGPPARCSILRLRFPWDT